MAPKKEDLQTFVDIDFYRSKYLKPIWERKWIVMTLALASILFSASIAVFIKPEYVSEASILIEQPRSKLSSSDIKKGAIAPNKATSSYVLSEEARLRSATFTSEVLKILSVQTKEDLRVPLNVKAQVIIGSRRLVEKVFGEKMVVKLKRFLGKSTTPQTEQAEREFMASELAQRVEIKARAGAGMITLTSKTLDKEIAPQIVKSYIDVWVASNIEENKKGIRAEREFAEKQRNEALKKFKTAEHNIIQFRRQYEIPGDLQITDDVELKLQLDQLKSDLEISKDNLNYMEKVLLEAQRVEAGIVGNIRILNLPLIPEYPSASKGRKIFLMGSLAGVLLGVGLVILLDTLKGTIRHESDIRQITDAPLLGRLPKL